MIYSVDSRPLYKPEQLQRLFRPRSIAVVGASANEKLPAGRTLANLKNFQGTVYPVNEKYEELGGRRCYPSISSLPEVPDCVVAAVRRKSIEPVALEAAACGVGGLVVYAAGYAETGLAENVAEQQRLRDIANRSGMRILGPNVIGVILHHQRFALAFTPELRFAEVTSAAIGIVTQSGGVGNALTQALNRGVSISHTLSTGNACDVDVADMVSYLSGQEECKAIALAFEAIETPARLIEAGRMARAAGKALVVYKFARSEAGMAAAVSHSGVLAGSYETYLAAFESVGAIVVPRFEQLIEVASFFAKAPSPKGTGIGVFSTSGGLAVHAADQADLYGVALPQPNELTCAVLRQAVPDYGTVGNPCDATAITGTDPARLEGCTRAMFDDPSYAAVLTPFVYARDDSVMALRRSALSGGARESGKIGLAIWSTEWREGPGAVDLEIDPHVGLFQSMESCMWTVAAWLRHGAATLKQTYPAPIPDAALAGVTKRILDGASSRNLTEREAKSLFAAYGIPVVQEYLALSAGDAARHADQSGGRFVLKVESPDIPHKTEAGAVKVGVSGAADVAAAFDEIMQNAAAYNPAAHINGVLVQPLVIGDLELVVGARVDAQFGPVILVGLGGIFTELMADVVTALAPVGADEAERMLRRLKGHKLLEGFRGRPAIDTRAVGELVARLSRLVCDNSARIAEVDINPVICGQHGAIAVDGLVILSSPVEHA